MARSLVIVESPAKAKTINKYLGRDYFVKASLGHVMDLPKKNLGIVLPGDDERPKKRRKAAGTAPKKPRKLSAHKNGKEFEPHYEIIPGKTKIINDLRKAASSADSVYLAADPDREGEAICAHLRLVLSKPGRFIPPPSSEQGNGNKDAKEPPARRAKSEIIPPTDRKKIFRVMFNEITKKAIQAAIEKPGQINENLVDAQQARRVLDRLVGYQISPLLWDKVRRGLSAGACRPSLCA